MTYCLDTDHAIEYLRDNPKVTAQVIAHQHEILLTPITLMELFYGAYRSNQSEKRVLQVQEFLAFLSVLPFSLKVYQEFGKIKASLATQGNIVDNFDLLIACFCKVHDCILVTNNTKHFSRFPEVKRENWI